MGTSHTSKKRRKKPTKNLVELANTQAATETIAQLLARLLDKWTKSELSRLVANNRLVCIDLSKNLYRIGNHTLQKHKDQSWSVRGIDGQFVHSFISKHAAVFYCLYESKRMYHKSREFLNMDAELDRMSKQVTEYVTYLKLAIEHKDTFKQDLYIARLSYAAPKLELLETNLQKSIISAKYSKVWEFNNHETTRTRH
jgi:hypothetical protein